MTQESLFQEHYLQVQALTQVSSHQSTPQNSLPFPSFNALIIACSLFAIACIAAAIYLLIHRTSDLKYFLVVISLAVGIGTVPVAVSLSQQPTDIRSQASTASAPQNIIITRIGTNGFIVTWTTLENTSGAIRLRQSFDQFSQQRVLTESGDPSTYHQISVSNLHPGMYYFEIFSDKYWFDNQGAPLSIRID